MKMPLKLLTAAALVVLAACAEEATAPQPESTPPSLSAAAIKDRYIVVLKGAPGSVSASAMTALAGRHGAGVSRTWSHALNGFAARMSAEAAARLAADPAVAYVAADQLVHVTITQTPTPSWGLDRVDQRNLPLNTRFNYAATGTGVHAYIIDTGIRITHTDFGGRASYGFDFIDNDPIADDCFGHGTHVSGTVGGTAFGVAKGVSLVAVRVLDCSGSGTEEQVISGVDWVTANAIKPAVANMSLGGSVFQPLNDAVANSIASGVSYALSAGNSAADACTQSPASTPTANTVGATAINDRRAPFSNFGTCVDIFAPGVNIVSDYNTDDNATATLSGTSMASPHVAGSIAQYLQLNPAATPAAVTSALTSNATAGKVINPGSGSPNLLLFSGFAR